MSEFEKLPLDKKRFTKTFMNNIGLFMGVFLIFAVVVIMTTDIHLASFEELASLGLDFFLLLFCSYYMYVCCADTGTKSGLATTAYNNTLECFESTKKRIIEKQLQYRLLDFCHQYIADELRSARIAVLSVVGIKHSEYREKYMALDEDSIEALDLTKPLKKAIKKANRIKPVKLTPEMILRHGRSHHRRSPLDMNPAKKKNVVFGVKFVQISLFSIGMSMIALDVIAEPSWVIFAGVVLKLVSVIVNGFSGYKFGYDNIVLDTINYMKGQIDLMEQAIQYCATTSEITTEISLVTP